MEGDNTKGHNETFVDDGHALYLDCGDGVMGIYL